MKPQQVTTCSHSSATQRQRRGVPGIGKKGAIDLVTQFGSLDAMLERVGELKPKQREALGTHRDTALQSRALVTIRSDVPLDIDLESLRYRGASRERCYELFSRLDFRVILPDDAPPPATADTLQKDYALVTTAEELERLLTELREAGDVAIRSFRPALRDGARIVSSRFP